MAAEMRKSGKIFERDIAVQPSTKHAPAWGVSKPVEPGMSQMTSASLSTLQWLAMAFPTSTA
jgi:hypothetical protein